MICTADTKSINQADVSPREREIICKRYATRDGKVYSGKALTQMEIAKQP